MNCKKIIFCAALGLAAMAVTATDASAKKKNTEAQAAMANISWTDNAGRVTYSTNATTAKVVQIALREFANDMKLVTGLEAKEKSGAPIQIYQLDLLTNKEFSAVEKLGAPLHKFITAKDAFYIGTRKNKIILIGSNARGTAYGIMRLSEWAGVTPMMAWNDLKPQPRRSLSTPVGSECLEIPRIEFRGLALNKSQWMKPENYSRIARLMLRLRANTLWQVDGKHEADYDKAVVDSFDICVAENHKVTEATGKKHKKKHRSIDNVMMACENPQMEIGNLSPGLLLEMLSNPLYLDGKHNHHDKSAKSHHSNNAEGEDCAWIANVTNPKKASLQLNMMMDLAWNKTAASKGAKAYLQNWLADLFGTETTKRIMPLMEEYYRLTSIRQPAYLSMPYGDTEFHSGEFGNELERYLYRYDNLKQKVTAVERGLPQEQNDGYFEIVKYPIYSAALVAEKELEAQEARHIARPGLFNNDEEAKTAAAVSIKAYEKLKQLNAYYARIAGGKWKDFVATRATEMQAPSLPGTLTAKEVSSLCLEAFDRESELKPLSQTTSDIIAKNAYEWSKATESPSSQDEAKGTEKISFIPLLGHSNKAVRLPKGATLSYTFASSMSGDARFTLAAIPNYGNQQSMQVSVSIDRATPVVCQLYEAPGSKEWNFNLWRGQALKNFYVTLPSGYHTVEIKALDDHVILDQWVLDYDVDREYYVMPVSK